MKKEQEIIPTSKVAKKTGPGSNPENKFKKGKPATAAELENVITSAVEKVKPHSSEGFTKKGTVPGYEEESWVPGSVLKGCKIFNTKVKLVMK